MDMLKTRTIISTFIVFTIGLHTVPVLQELQNKRQSLWPVMAWGMFRYSHNSEDPISTVVERVIGLTARGEEVWIQASHSGLDSLGFAKMYLGPMSRGEMSAVQELAKRVNLGRNDPVVAFRFESKVYTIVDSGIEEKNNPDIHYRLQRN